MSFLALSLSRKISYAKNFVLLPPEIPGGRYNLLLIAVNQIFYHRFIGLLLKLHDLLLCHVPLNLLLMKRRKKLKSHKVILIKTLPSN